MNNFTLANPEDLTKYEVVGESWITDGRGHSALRSPAAEGEEKVTVDLHPAQAEYLITSGQVRPIPGETRGYPADAVSGEPLKLSDEERRAVQDLPPLSGDEVNEVGTSEVKPETSVSLGNASSDEAAQQETAQDALKPETATQTQDTKTRKGRS